MTRLAETEAATLLYCNACASIKGKCSCLADAAEFLGNDWDFLVELSHRGQLLTLLNEQRYYKAMAERAEALAVEFSRPRAAAADPRPAG